MAQCANCGNVLNPADTFCGRCGTAVAGAGAPPPPPPPPPQQQWGAPQQQPGYPPPPQYGYPPPAGAKPYAQEDSIHCFLAYFGIFSLIPYLMFKDKKFDPRKEYIWWHARQGLALCLASFAFWIVWWVLFAVAPFGLWAVLSLLATLVWLGVLGVMILGWVKAFGGQKFEIPLIAQIAAIFP